MKTAYIRVFLYSAAVLLLGTAVAKFVSAGGSARILQNPDPILGIPFRSVFCIVGSVEAVVAFLCFVGKRMSMQAGLVAWLATNFVIYRAGLLWVGYHEPCSCLGNLTDALHISPGAADTGMKIILAYLLIGSYGTLFWLWRQKRETFVPSQSPKAAVSGS